jgi:hypothetical protein
MQIALIARDAATWARRRVILGIDSFLSGH